MATYYLVRHGANDCLSANRIAGRAAGVSLNEEGRSQAEAVARFLASRSISAIFTSPLERARETAAPLAARLAVEARAAEELLEIDFGEWTGKTHAELERDPRWKTWNNFRANSRIPGGETMLEAQARVCGFIERLERARADGHVALFGHGDPIRAALLYYLGMPLDFYSRIQIAPGSVSILQIGPGWIEVSALNLQPAAFR